MRQTKRLSWQVFGIGTTVAAGLAGGLAEVLWVAIYSVLTGSDVSEIASQVTVSVFPALGGAAGTVWLGLGIHFGLSLLLAAGFVLVVGRSLVYRPARTAIAAVAALAAVWVVNFLLILPVLNPAFIALLPYPVTLFSKLLFGLAMAQVLAMTSRAGAPLVADTASRTLLALPGR